MIVKCCSYIICHLVIIFTYFHLNIHYSLGLINSFLASGDFYCLLIALANSLDAGQYRQNVSPGLDTGRLPPSDSVPVSFF